MNITITPGKLSGTVEAIPSKSMAHRMLICAAFCDRETELICPETSRDIEATVDCLKALGASILPTASGYQVIPIKAYIKIPTRNIDALDLADVIRKALGDYLSPSADANNTDIIGAFVFFKNLVGYSYKGTPYAALIHKLCFNFHQ